MSAETADATRSALIIVSIAATALLAGLLREDREPSASEHPPAPYGEAE